MTPRKEPVATRGEAVSALRSPRPEEEREDLELARTRRSLLHVCVQALGTVRGFLQLVTV